MSMKQTDLQKIIELFFKIKKTLAKCLLSLMSCTVMGLCIIQIRWSMRKEYHFTAIPFTKVQQKHHDPWRGSWQELVHSNQHAPQHQPSFLELDGTWPS